MNKFSKFALGMAIGLTWMIAIISTGFFAMYILKDGKVVSQKVGASDYKTVSDWVKENI